MEKMTVNANGDFRQPWQSAHRFFVQDYNSSEKEKREQTDRHSLLPVV
jgi:hypothetical protein